MGNIVIVGGGVAGLVAALTLQGRHRITVVEKATRCGGLMRSFTNSSGIAFDYGTHVLCDTGSQIVDRLLFDRIRNPSWRRFKALKTGGYFAGKLYDQSPHVDLRSLPKDVYDRAISELLSGSSGDDTVPNSFVAQLQRDFGPTITDFVQRPAMRKIFDCELEELLPDNPFVLKRFVAFDAEKSRELKLDPRLDSKLAFATYADGVPSIDSYYPREGGVGQWVESICSELERSGVIFATGQGIGRIEHDTGTVNGVVLENGSKIPCDMLLWSAPPSLLLRAMGFTPRSAPLKSRPMSLFHFCFDKPFLCGNYYVTNYDEAYKSFRITLYPNLQERAYNGVYHCTVEAIGEVVTADMEAEIRTELESMGILPPDASTLSCDYEFLPIGFPTLTKAFLDVAHDQVEMVRTSTKGVELLGRAKHDAFSILAVALEAHDRASRLL